MLKVIAPIIAIIPLFGISLTSLIMSTGAFWKCPGEPRLFTWLLGFGIDGILFSWLLTVIIIERRLKDHYDNDRPVIISYAITIIILYLFAFIWSIVGIQWTSSASYKSTNYYMDGKNLFCDSVVYRYTQAMSIITLTLVALTLTMAVNILKLSH